MNSSDQLKQKLRGNETKPQNIDNCFSGMKSNNIAQVLGLYRDQISHAIPKHMTVDRIIQLSTAIITTNQKLAECTIESIIGAVIQCAAFGFEPSPILGQCYFIPRKNYETGKKEVEFVLGYKGMIDLAQRSGKILTIYSYIVYENDNFHYEYGLNPKLIHKPVKKNRGEFIFVYAVAKYTNGGANFCVLSKDEVIRIKLRSKTADSEYSPWNHPDDSNEMTKKSALRKLFKYMPISIEHRKLIVVDENVLNSEKFKNGEYDLNNIDNLNLEIKNDQKEEKNV